MRVRRGNQETRFDEVITGRGAAELDERLQAG